MKQRAMFGLLLLFGVLGISEGWGASPTNGTTVDVTVWRQINDAAKPEQLEKGKQITAEVGKDFRTDPAWAAAIEGFRFQYWTFGPKESADSLINRDPWGRAYEAALLKGVRAQTKLTAVYGPAATGEAVYAEADKVYWYGTKSGDVNDAYNTDGDAYGFKDEIQYGLNPHFKDELTSGGTSSGSTALVWFNGINAPFYRLMSKPENTLFLTIDETRVQAGTSVTTPAYNPLTTTFAYWTVDGVRNVDTFGRSRNAAEFIMPNKDIDVVAHCFDDEAQRLKAYWYGPNGDASVDTDKDGYTFDEEMQYGLNPYMKDELVSGGVTSGSTALVWFNGINAMPYVIQANPAETFAKEEGFLAKGQMKTTDSYVGEPTFAYWDLDTVRQVDMFGRALDAVTIAGYESAEAKTKTLTAHFIDGNEPEREAQYWYGMSASAVDRTTDTDGDGISFDDEMRFGLNPYMKDDLTSGGVTTGCTNLVTLNVQTFDRLTKMLINGAVTEVFGAVESILSQPDADTWNGAFVDIKGGIDFGGATSVAVLDADSDGLFDLLVAVKAATGKVSLRLYRNIGAVGAPNFTVEENVYPELAEALAEVEHPVLCGGMMDGGPAVWFCKADGTVASFSIVTKMIFSATSSGFPVWSANDGAGILSGDTVTFADKTVRAVSESVEAVQSAALADVTGDGLADLLVADANGRISLYAREGDGYVLKHRVWGGSFVGFAEGLRLAPIDWDSDGDMDMVCGTKAGKLLLLSDPNIGHPTNLTATAGYDNVLLTWDPNAQSRVSGYRVYRSQSTDFDEIARTVLPKHRDTQLSAAVWAYRVSAVSRRWTAGNSTPEIYESPYSEVVKATVGSMELSIPESRSAYYGWDVTVPVSINNTHSLSAKDMSFTVTYDATKLTPKGYRFSPLLAEGMTFQEDTSVAGTWTVETVATNTGKTVATGSGELVYFTFTAKTPESAPATDAADVQLTAVTLTSDAGKPIKTTPALPLTTTVDLSALPKTELRLDVPNVRVKAGHEVQVVVTVSKTKKTDVIDWNELTLTADVDASLLTQVGTSVVDEASSTVTFTFKAERIAIGYTTEVVVTGSAPNTTVQMGCGDVDIRGLPHVRLLANDVTVQSGASEKQIELPVTLKYVGPVDFGESLKVTAKRADGTELTLKDGTTMGAPVFLYPVPANLTADMTETITFTVSAQDMDGDAALTQGTSATVTVRKANLPPQVTLSAPDCTVVKGTSVKVPVRVDAVGELDWNTLKFTVDGLTGLTKTVTKAPLATNPVAELELTVPESAAGDSVRLTVSATATGSNGTQAVVTSAMMTLTLVAPEVPPEIRLSAEDKEAETKKVVEIPVRLEVLGNIDWTSVKVEAAYDTAKLEPIVVPDAVKPTAENSVVLFRFNVKELHEDLSTVLTFTATAKAASGDKPVKVTSCRCMLTLIDSNPIPVAPLSLVVKSIRWVPEDDDKDDDDLNVRITVGFEGDQTVLDSLAWSTKGQVKITPTYNRHLLEKERFIQPTTANHDATFEFEPEDDLEERVATTVTFSAKVSDTNGNAVGVLPVACTLTLEEMDDDDHDDEDRVKAWTNGDCDGDGKLTSHDYKVAWEMVVRYHRTHHPKVHSTDKHAVDVKVHRSICQALGRKHDAALKIFDIPTRFKRYLWKHGVRHFLHIDDDWDDDDDDDDRDDD